MAEKNLDSAAESGKSSGNAPVERDLACEIIAVEEHFMHPSLTDHFGGAAHQPPRIMKRLYDYAETRIGEMDAAGINMQVLSHQSPGSQRLPDEIAVSACRRANDALAEIISRFSDRFRGFAMIPTMHPRAAADELRRAVEELGLKGAMIHGLSRGKFVDEISFWPIFAQAESLSVPIYLHPALPDRAVTERYYAPYGKSHPDFIRAGWGFGIEAGTQAVRLVLSGIFERHPDLKIVLGHLGESIPFLLTRIDESLGRPGNIPTRFSEIFLQNFWVTTSGFFSDAALQCCLDSLDPGRILFAVDWPYADNKRGVEWLSSMGISEKTKKAIFAGNARSLLNL